MIPRYTQQKNGYRMVPQMANKILPEASKMIEAYLQQYKEIYPKPMVAKERTRLMNMCRNAPLTKKHLSGFLSLVKQNTELEIIYDRT